jgi:DNA (cytosine-5)-methyltransferase 1
MYVYTHTHTYNYKVIHMDFTIGSLFDGSGGFPLSAFLCGGTPVWASEIEPYPIAVTKTRFPYMKHLGSVTEVKGDEVEPVSVISFGSPCQDLSVAGKRAGLKHEDNGDDETTRSGLFMEAVRIIKEMREKTNGEYPRFAVWENVPGAFSSNKGEDFRIVLEELIKIAEPTTVMPGVPPKGWAYADSFSGDGWSLAYRVLDAQYWGVPQRRRRIYLVADFGGQCAREVLFEREGLRGYFETCGTPWRTAPGDVEVGVGAADCERKCYGISSYNSNAMMSDNPHSGIYEADTSRTLDLNGGNPSCNQGRIAVVENIPYTLKIRSGCEGGGKGALIQNDMSATLSTLNDQYLFQPVSAGFCTEPSEKSRSIGYEVEVAPTLRAGVVPAVVRHQAYSIENHPADSRVNLDESGKVQTLTGRMGTGGGNVPMVMEPTYCIDGDKLGKAEREGGSGLGVREGDTMYTLTAKDKHGVAYLASGKGTDGTLMANAGTKLWLGNQEAFSGDYHIVEEHTKLYRQGGFGEYVEGNAGTDRASGGDYGGGSENLVVHPSVQYIVRRLTPTECARLQGFPDWWAHPDKKDDFTDEEYAFWLNVRNNNAEINGKQTKDYTKAQMLTWYNKLHTDSSEYKLWGNGIALPNSLYVMQGISEVFEHDCRK